MEQEIILPRMKEEWIEVVFDRFRVRWGDKWRMAFDGFREADAIRHWCEGLATLTRQDLKRGLAAVVGDEYPPSMGEFRKACLDRGKATELKRRKKLPRVNKTPTAVEAHDAHMAKVRDALK